MDIKLDPVSQEYCLAVRECVAVKMWLAEASSETEIVNADELDHPSVALY